MIQPEKQMVVMLLKNWVTVSICKSIEEREAIQEEARSQKGLLAKLS